MFNVTFKSVVFIHLLSRVYTCCGAENVEMANERTTIRKFQEACINNLDDFENAIYCKNPNTGPPNTVPFCFPLRGRHGIVFLQHIQVKDLAKVQRQMA